VRKYSVAGCQLNGFHEVQASIVVDGHRAVAPFSAH
jgi:hypothetical protein